MQDALMRKLSLQATVAQYYWGLWEAEVCQQTSELFYLVTKEVRHISSTSFHHLLKIAPRSTSKTPPSLDSLSNHIFSTSFWIYCIYTFPLSTRALHFSIQDTFSSYILFSWICFMILIHI